MLAMMCSMIESELKVNRALIKEGVLHTNGQMRKIVHIHGEPKELLIRPQCVFGAILGLSDRCSTEAEAVLRSACTKAERTLVEHVVRLLEPKIIDLKDSTYLKRFAVLTASGLVRAKL